MYEYVHVCVWTGKGLPLEKVSSVCDLIGVLMVIFLSSL